MTENKHIQNIIENYKNMEKEIVRQINYVSNHGTTVGSNREYIWKSLFERIIPKKFNIDRSVFIMDSFGNISKEVDLAIYDEQYTPYIFRYGTIKFIPIEAVAAAIECKSSGAKKNALSEWLKSINNLNTGTDSIVRLTGYINYGIELNKLNEKSKINQTSTTPIKILCHMGVSNKVTEEFDIVIKVHNEQLIIKFNESYENLYDWYLQLNHYSGGRLNADRKKKIKNFVKNNIENVKNNIENVKNNIENVDKYSGLKDRSLEDYEVDKGNTILSFIFQFNQLLMLINNPLFFPHMDYVKMFKKKHNENLNEN